MTEVLTLNVDSRLLSNNGRFNVSSSTTATGDGGTGSLRERVSLVRWTHLKDDDRSYSMHKTRSSDGSKRSAGLKNLGNTCFLNSIVQCLTHTKPLFDYCVSGQYKTDLNSSSKMNGSLISAFARLAELLRDGEILVAPSDFKTQISRFASQFVGNSQQDAQEFLIYLLEGLHEDVNCVNNNNNNKEQLQPAITSLPADQWKKYLHRHCNSRIIDMFVGVLRSSLTCQVCKHVSECFEPFVDLSLPVDCSPFSTSSFSLSTTDPETTSGEVSLLECLQLLVQQELLDEDNRPECERCKQRQRAMKSFSIDRFPPILILHLKRFNHCASSMFKVATDVKCPLYKLDLTRYATDTDNTSAVYNLYAVCNHTGLPNNGHYTACARQFESDRWFCFDDARVQPVDSSLVVTSDSYILFYELSDTTSSRL